MRGVVEKPGTPGATAEIVTRRPAAVGVREHQATGELPVPNHPAARISTTRTGKYRPAHAHRSNTRDGARTIAALASRTQSSWIARRLWAGLYSPRTKISSSRRPESNCISLKDSLPGAKRAITLFDLRQLASIVMETIGERAASLTHFPERINRHHEQFTFGRHFLTLSTSQRMPPPTSTNVPFPGSGMTGSGENRMLSMALKL